MAVLVVVDWKTVRVEECDRGVRLTVQDGHSSASIELSLSKLDILVSGLALTQSVLNVKQSVAVPRGPVPPPPENSTISKGT